MEQARSDLVLSRRGVALRASQQGVAGDCLGTGDSAMAGTALFGHVRGFRLMRVVARDTGFHRVVTDRVNLRKSGGAAGIIPVAEGAVSALAGRRQLVVDGRQGVRGCRSVTVFAGNCLVPSLGVHLHDVAMALGAGFATRVAYGTFPDAGDRRRPVVATLSKSLWDQYLSREDKPADENSKNDKQTCKLLRHPTHQLSGRRHSASLGCIVACYLLHLAETLCEDPAARKAV